MGKIKDKRSIIILALICAFLFGLFQAKDLDVQKELYKKNSIVLFDNTDGKITHQFLDEIIEKIARYQARLTAKGIGDCIVDSAKTYNYTTKIDLMKSIAYCSSYHRNFGLEGDPIIVEFISKKIRSDNSPDCLKGGLDRDFNAKLEKQYLSKKEQKGECFMHYNKKMCVETIEKLNNTPNTDENNKITWRFDDDLEWLEAYTIPSPVDGFNGKIGLNGVINPNNIQLQIIMGTQKDEVMKLYKPLYDKVDEVINHANNYIDGILWIIYYLFILLAFSTIISILIIKGLFGK